MKTITQAEYLQLVGLLALARHHNRMLRDIESAAKQITGDNPDKLGSGHTGDAIACDYEPAELLRKLSITVEAADSATIVETP